MPVNQTQLFDPPTRAAVVDSKGFLSVSFRQWLFTLQYLMPLVTVDTTAGPISDAPPPAGLNSSTGQSNQNMEITYVKSSVDVNTFTLNGVMGGPYTLTAQFDTQRIKSDGTNWWPV